MTEATVAVRRPGLLRSLLLVGLFTARRIAWSRKTLVMAILLLIPATLVIVIRGQAPPGTVEDFRRIALPNLEIGLLELLCLFYGGSIVRDAMEDRTLAFFLTRPLGRFRVILGFCLGQLLLVLPFILISATVAHVACKAGAGLGAADLLGGPLPRLLAVLTGGAVFYGGLFTLFALFFRHPTIIGLAFIMICEGFLGSIPGALRRVAPITYFESLLLPWFETRASLKLEGRPGDDYAVEPGPALVTLIVLGLLILFLLRLLAARKDLIPFVKRARGE